MSKTQHNVFVKRRRLLAYDSVLVPWCLHLIKEESGERKLQKRRDFALRDPNPKLKQKHPQLKHLCPFPKQRPPLLMHVLLKPRHQQWKHQRPLRKHQQLQPLRRLQKTTRACTSSCSISINSPRNIGNLRLA